MAAKNGKGIALRDQGRPKNEVAEKYICPLCSTDGIVNPVLELLRWQQILEVLGIPRDKNVMSGNHLCRDEDISVTLPGSRLLFQAPYESQDCSSKYRK